MDALPFSPARFVAELTAWYRQHRRDLPWRQSRDPYRVWLSEIMLQQTQVATVIPYYEKFLARFPTVESLAAAPLDEVLKLWAGLGYYSRARNLHRGAQAVAGVHGGVFPRTRAEIREVPGIGEYTAGAVLSIAHGLPEALVDGNVARVLARVLLLDGDWRKGPGKERTWSAARTLVAACAEGEADPGDYNQGLMELGATVCTPRSPQCLLCPLSAFCAARAKGVQHAYPQLDAAKESPVWTLRAHLVEDSEGRILFAQRGDSGLFAGLWELPAERVAKLPMRPKPLAVVEHTLTHRVLQIAVCRAPLAAWKKGLAEAFTPWSGNYTGVRWVAPADALAGETVALPAVQRKVLAAVAAGGSGVNGKTK